MNIQPMAVTLLLLAAACIWPAALPCCAAAAPQSGTKCCRFCSGKPQYLAVLRDPCCTVDEAQRRSHSQHTYCSLTCHFLAKFGHEPMYVQLLPRQRHHHGMHGRFQLLQVPHRLQCICHETSDDTTEFGHHMIDEVDSTAPATNMMSALPILTSSPVVKAYTVLSCRTVRQVTTNAMCRLSGIPLASAA